MPEVPGRAVMRQVARENMLQVAVGWQRLRGDVACRSRDKASVPGQAPILAERGTHVPSADSVDALRTADGTQPADRPEPGGGDEIGQRERAAGLQHPGSLVEKGVTAGEVEDAFDRQHVLESVVREGKIARIALTEFDTVLVQWRDLLRGACQLPGVDVQADKRQLMEPFVQRRNGAPEAASGVEYGVAFGDLGELAKLEGELFGRLGEIVVFVR